jgi:hypothetical protein
MKVIFLDIDGVLNTTTTPKPTQDARVVDRTLLSRLTMLVQHTGAQVVLSSTWRHDPDGLTSAERLGIPFMDVLPDMRPRPRNEEIKAWLGAHPNVQRFIVIDDDDDDLDAFPLFQPSASTGITDKIVEAATDYLNSRSEHDMRRNVIVRCLQRVRTYLKGHNG